MSSPHSSVEFDSKDVLKSLVVPEQGDFDCTEQLGAGAESVDFKLKLESGYLVQDAAKRLKLDVEDNDTMDVNFEDSYESTGSRTWDLDENGVPTMRGVNAILFDGTFFEIVQKMQETKYQREQCGIVAMCKHCPNNQRIKGSLGVSSNFIYHLKHKHPLLYNEFSLKKAESAKTPRARHRRSVFNNYEEKLLNFICDNCMPFSTVQHHSFRDLFTGTGIQLSDPQNLEKLLDRKHQTHVANITELLATVTNCCATIDVFSDGQLFSYLTYACHWLDPKTLERHSAALACRRFKFQPEPSAKEINAAIASIQQKYNLNEHKIVRTITENFGNFKKYYKEFGALLDVDDLTDDIVISQFEDDYFLEESIAGLTDQNHLRCASHQLNILASIDYFNILNNDEALLAKHQQAFSRCSSLWYRCKYTKSAAVIKNMLGFSLSSPHASRWNSLFDSLKQLLAQKEQLPLLCMRLTIPQFNLDDIEYLEEYVALMTPLANALDFLQRSDNLYFGYFIASLVTIKVKLCKLYDSNTLKYLQQVCKELQDKLLQRFQTYFEIRGDEGLDAMVATISCPSIKMKFFNVLRDTAKHYTVESLKQAFIHYAAAFLPVQKEQNSNSSNGNNNDSLVQNNSTENFLDFGEPQTISSEQQALHELKIEFENYMADIDASLSCLRRYPTIRQLFIQYNTPLPSSSRVERLFSIADILKRSQQQHLTDDQHEKFVLFRVNHYSGDLQKTPKTEDQSI